MLSKDPEKRPQISIIKERLAKVTDSFQDLSNIIKF